MNKWVKLLIGGAGTSLLAWGAHATGGQNYVAGLGERSAQALSAAGIDGVTLDDPAQYSPLSRVMVLSGEGLSAEQRAAAEKAVLAVSGVSAVRWAGASADDGLSKPMSKPGDAATAEAVSSCQGGVDEAVAGKSINFNSGSTYMPDASLAIVSEVADVLKACEGLSVTIGGHTDATGSAEVNQNLSQGRADAVAAALTERGVAADRITATGFGSAQPKVEGDGANAANRRIEFTISSSGSGPAAPAKGE